MPSKTPGSQERRLKRAFKTPGPVIFSPRSARVDFSKIQGHRRASQIPLNRKQKRRTFRHYARRCGQTQSHGHSGPSRIRSWQQTPFIHGIGIVRAPWSALTLPASACCMKDDAREMLCHSPLSFLECTTVQSTIVGLYLQGKPHDDICDDIGLDPVLQGLSPEL